MNSLRGTVLGATVLTIVLVGSTAFILIRDPVLNPMAATALVVIATVIGLTWAARSGTGGSTDSGAGFGSLPHPRSGKCPLSVRICSGEISQRDLSPRAP